MSNRKYLGHTPAKKLSRWRAKRFFRGWTDHHRPRVPCKEQQAVFQSGHHGIHVFTHGAENLMHSAELLANLRNFPAHLAQFVAAPCETRDLGYRRVVLPGGYAVQLQGNPCQWRERGSADNRGEN